MPLPPGFVRTARGLARRPGFAPGAGLTLAVAIGVDARGGCLVPALRSARLDPAAIREP
jgi:hypothetical protein